MTLEKINDLYENHPLVNVMQGIKERSIRTCFNSLMPEELNDYHYSLYRFSSAPPLNYINQDVISNSIEFFQLSTNDTLDGLAMLSNQLNHAIFSLIRETPSWKLDKTLSLNNPEDYSEFDSIWHPEYQRYSEHVLNHLINLPLYLLGKKKSKNYITQPFGNRVKILDDNSLDYFYDGFKTVLRNSISHGTMSYELGGINYIDKNGSKFLSHYGFSELFDHLVATCNSILCAILLFLSNNSKRINNYGLSKLPLGIRFLLVNGITSHYGFTPSSMIESKLDGSKKQLNAVCKISSTSRSNHIFEGLSLARSIYMNGGSDYDRYFISMQCGQSIPSSVVINGGLLREAIDNNVQIDKLPIEMFKNSLLWYDTSQLKRKFYIYSNLLKPGFQNIRYDFVQNFEEQGIDIISRKYKIRRIENCSSEKYGRINAHVILRTKEEITNIELLKISKHALRQLKRKRIKRINTSGEFGFHVKPRYINIRFYSEDKIFRRLKALSWVNDELVACCEWIYSRNVMDYFYTKQCDLIHNRIRLKFNPSITISEKK